MDTLNCHNVEDEVGYIQTNSLKECFVYFLSIYAYVHIYVQ